MAWQMAGRSRSEVYRHLGWVVQARMSYYRGQVQGLLLPRRRQIFCPWRAPPPPLSLSLLRLLVPATSGRPPSSPPLVRGGVASSSSGSRSGSGSGSGSEDDGEGGSRHPHGGSHHHHHGQSNCLRAAVVATSEVYRRSRTFIEAVQSATAAWPAIGPIDLGLARDGLFGAFLASYPQPELDWLMARWRGGQEAQGEGQCGSFRGGGGWRAEAAGEQAVR